NVYRHRNGFQCSLNSVVDSVNWAKCSSQLHRMRGGSSNSAQPRAFEAQGAPPHGPSQALDSEQPDYLTSEPRFCPPLCSQGAQKLVTAARSPAGLRTDG